VGEDLEVVVDTGMEMVMETTGMIENTVDTDPTVEMTIVEIGMRDPILEVVNMNPNSEEETTLIHCKTAQSHRA